MRSSICMAAEPRSVSGPKASLVVYRHDKVEEAELPDQPGVRLRRTTIDEVIVQKIEEKQ